MDKVFARFIAIFCLILSFQTQASEKDWFFKPYIGGDLGAQRLEWEQGFGDFHFREHYPFMNLNLGVMLHPYIGVEMGYEHMFERQRKQYYTDTVPVLGFYGHVLTGLGEQSYLSEAHMNGFNLNLLLRYPVLEKTELVALFGAAWNRLEVNTLMIQDGNAANRPLFWQSDRTAIARIALGVRHMITDNFGGRIMYLWENTSKLDARLYPGADIVANQAVLTPGDPASSFHAQPKNSHTFMAGFFYQADWY